MSDVQLLILSSVAGLVVSFITARATASSEAVSSLSNALASLRSEFEAVQKERKAERREREAYKAYIDVLVKLLNTHQIAVPPFDYFDGDKIRDDLEDRI